MGFLGAIGDFLTGTYHEDYEHGANWAERVYTSGDDLNHEEVSMLADDYGSDPDAFYDGYRDNWNDYVHIHNMHVAYQNGEEYKEPGTFEKFRNWCKGY